MMKVHLLLLLLSITLANAFDTKARVENLWIRKVLAESYPPWWLTSYNLALSSYLVDDEDETTRIFYAEVDETLGNTVPLWDICPNGTRHILQLQGGSLNNTGGEDHISMGCCPQGQQGCFNLDHELVGCCPDSQFCAVDQSQTKSGPQQFMGCVEYASQVCYDRVCPPGYGCCLGLRGRKSCIPFGDLYDPYDYESYCGLATQTKAEWPRYYAFKDGSPLANTSLELPADDGAFLRVCSSGYICNYNETCLDGNSRYDNTTTNTTDLFCLPQHGGLILDDAKFNYDVCFNGYEPYLDMTDPDVYVVGQVLDEPTSLHQVFSTSDITGFANVVDLDEECCGKAVCPRENQCCHARLEAVFNATGVPETRELTLGRFCCPDAMQCCLGSAPDYGFLADSPLVFPVEDGEGNAIHSLLGHFKGFCGMALGGVDCAMNRLQPGSRYLTKK